MENEKEHTKSPVTEERSDGEGAPEDAQTLSPTEEAPKKTRRKSRTERLKEDLEATRTEAEENRDRWLRALAELENVRKRTKRELDMWIRTANEQLVLSLLPVLDSFERALDHTTSEESDSESLQEGIELIFSQLKGALEKAGVTAIEAKDHPFDPNFHEAVMQMESEEHDSGVVLEEIERGYRLNDRVIRPAKVVVNR